MWVNYALSKLLVFQKKTSGAEKAKEMFVFAVVAVTGLAMTEGLMWVFTEKLNWYYMISKAVAAIIVLFSRTTPFFPTFSLPASNWGLIRHKT